MKQTEMSYKHELFDKKLFGDQTFVGSPATLPSFSARPTPAASNAFPNLLRNLS